MKDVEVKSRVDSLTVKDGECLTVYLQVREKSILHIQVELRVNRGKPEIFCDGVDIKSFDDWYLGE